MVLCRCASNPPSELEDDPPSRFKAPLALGRLGRSIGCAHPVCRKTLQQTNLGSLTNLGRKIGNSRLKDSFAVFTKQKLFTGTLVSPV